MFEYYSNQKIGSRSIPKHENDPTVSTYASFDSRVGNDSSLSSCDYQEKVDDDFTHPTMHPTPPPNSLEDCSMYHGHNSVQIFPNRRLPFLEPLMESSEDCSYGQHYSYEARTYLEVLEQSNDTYSYDVQSSNPAIPLPSYLNIPSRYDDKYCQLSNLTDDAYEKQQQEEYVFTTHYIAHEPMKVLSAFRYKGS
ncbi:hypothetical protein C8J55DRAFT_553319 [Lentinula edodes]|uniref:Uncharacterized protein n=1 Tax=Lentinula lateritia TaxID=40482 RepID=A0A9W9DDC1_9AGAR|nr:hypothetical protein C8J55DRAFT_553319 [Lentinula edodes]